MAVRNFWMTASTYKASGDLERTVSAGPRQAKGTMHITMQIRDHGAPRDAGTLICGIRADGKLFVTLNTRHGESVQLIETVP